MATTTNRVEVRNRGCALLIGIGLALMPIHNKWLTALVTSDGEVGFFIPAFGTAIWLMGALMFAVWNWEQLRKVGLGDKRIWIPLTVIVAAIAISGAVTGSSIQDKVSPLFMGVSMFALYAVARVLGKDMFLPLAIGAAVASLSVIAYQLLHPGIRSGGYLFELNYDIVVGYVLLGAALYFHKRQWLLAGLAIIAMFASGSPEAVFCVGILAITVLLRKDWSKKLLIIIVSLVILASVYIGIGHGKTLYSYAVNIAQNNQVSTFISKDRFDAEDIASGNDTVLGIRIKLIKDSLTDLQSFGEGYYVTAFKRNTVHNVPMIIVQQLGYPGMIAGLAWLWVTIYCLVKTRWKYVFVLILALSVFDHFVWTQIGSWWWAIVGASTVTAIKSDYIFKVVK